MEHASAKWPDRIVIVRHAESVGNERREYLRKIDSKELTLGLDKRDADFELTPRGREQARVTGHRLNEHAPFDVAYVSPLERTVQTAEEICSGLAERPRIVLEERLREKEFGVLEGFTHHGRKVKFPEEDERRSRVGKYYHRPPGGESYPDVNLRVHSFLDTLIREHAGARVLIVTHSVVILCFRRTLERLDEQTILHIDEHDEVKNAAVLVYDLAGRHPGEGDIRPAVWNTAFWEPAD